MFEIIFDSIREDFNSSDFEECYKRNKSKLKEVVGTTNFCFTENYRIDLRRFIDSEDFRDYKQMTMSFIDKFYESYNHCKFLIAVPFDSNVARICLDENPHAKWGVVVDDCFGFVYDNLTDNLILHETLHIFGADDCYKFNNYKVTNDRICGHANCIMQYNPCNASLKPHEWICEQNVSRIRKEMSEYSARKVGGRLFKRE